MENQTQIKPENQTQVNPENQTQVKSKKYVAYYRVSTKMQELGIDSQKLLVSGYLLRNGVCSGVPDFEFEEKESGKNSNRPELNNAIKKTLELDSELKKLGKDSGCRLVIANLSRLSRNVKFISTLMETN